MLIFLLVCVLCCTAQTVRVEGVALNFIEGTPIPQANIIVIETNQQTVTDATGRFHFNFPVGSNVTMVFTHSSFMETQSATIFVPPDGISGKQNEIVFQVPSTTLWEFFKLVLPETPLPNKCHVVVTVCAKGKTIYDDPQGEPESVATIIPSTPQKPFYFGYFDGVTNPFIRGLNSTSLDGGVLWFNVDPLDKPYTIVANKPGFEFSQTQIWCRKGGEFINAAPNQGPRVIKP